MKKSKKNGKFPKMNKEVRESESNKSRDSANNDYAGFQADNKVKAYQQIIKQYNSLYSH